MFIDREEELKALEERWKSKKAEFMVLYGRRRVGKTELINKLIEGKRGIRLLGRTESEKNHLDRFSADLAAFFKERGVETLQIHAHELNIERYRGQRCANERKCEKCNQRPVHSAT